MRTLVFLCLLSFFSTEALADDPVSSPAEVSGSGEIADLWTLGLGLGFGQQYAGLGANVSGYVRVHGIFSLGAFGSVGLVDLDTCCNDWGYNAGALAAWGWTDRVALAASFGTVWNERVGGDDRVVNGVTVAVGYEKMTRLGFWFRWLAGVAFPTDELVNDNKDAIPSINVGLGWKI